LKTPADGEVFLLKLGMGYQIADNAKAHQSRTDIGTTRYASWISGVPIPYCVFLKSRFNFI
jgi:hypothetical protein